MRKFWVLLKINLQGQIEYRGDIAVWTFAGFVTPIVSLALWLTLSGSGSQLKLNHDEIVIYFLLASFVETITGAWAGYFIRQQIIDGEFSKYLLKPYSFLLYNLSQNLAEKVYKIFFLSLGISVVLIFFFNNLPLQNLFNPFLIVLFLISLVMAIFVTFVLDCALGLITFWFHDADFLRTYVFIISQLLSGALIPLVFLPEALRSIVIFLPFRYFLSFPIEIITNRLSGLELVQGFALQIFWTATIFVFYQYLYKGGVKVHQAFGS